MHTLAQLRAGELAGGTHLKLACGLEAFPKEIFGLADTLETLDLSGNALSRLPDDFGRLRNLRILFCSGNAFTELPEVLGQCPQLSMVGFKANRIRTVPPGALPAPLRWLILTDNRIDHLPEALGLRPQLQKLMLAGNRLDALPESLAGCQRLELLRVAANRLPGLPPWLFLLPRLAWLAYAGNPCCAGLERQALAAADARLVPWRQLALGQALGQGASGTIHQGWRHHDGDGQPVAVKLYKSAITSDGLPESEMAAALAAGHHPNLVSAHAKISGHPDRRQGLVMPLLPPAYRPLAAPPSFASCTRDVYPEDARFPLPALLAITCGIAAAVGHLHRLGIAHGDLYAHNIVHNGQGHALLGDFGAASFYPGADAAMAAGLQRIEALAFGLLLEELLARCPPTPATGPLQALALACVHPQPAQRPPFADIGAALQAAAAAVGH